MTWRTPLGERVLNLAEAVLFRAVIDSIRDELREEAMGNEQWNCGVRAFDDLTFPQRLWMLCEVSEALLSSDTPSPKLTAINEGTVAAIYKALEQQLTFELELLAQEPREKPSEFAGYWRRLVQAAALSTIGEEHRSLDPAEIPDVECDDIEEWHGIVEVLSERVLWDTDYDDEDLYSDHPPEIAGSVKRASGIPDGYFIAIAHEPRDDEVERLFERLGSQAGQPITRHAWPIRTTGWTTMRRYLTTSQPRRVATTRTPSRHRSVPSLWTTRSGSCSSSDSDSRRRDISCRSW